MKRGPLGIVLFALLLLFIGERTLADLARLITTSAGGLLLTIGLVMVLQRWLRGEGDHRRAYRRILMNHLLGAAGVGLYFVQSDLIDWIPAGDARTLAMVLWPTLLVLGVVPAAAMELALRSVEKAPRLELWRIRLAARSARIVVLAIIGFAGINYAASTWNKKIDLSYFQTTRVGGATKKLVETLTKPVRFIAFFPPGNDVLEHARDYLEDLSAASSHASFEIADQALRPALAKEYKVRSNGYIVIASNDKNETLRLGTDMEAADDTLRELDQQIHQRLIKVLRPPRVAYLTTGHLERDYAPPSDDKRLGLRGFKDTLEAMGFSVKRLGASEGLGSTIPDDATLLVVPGPTQPFLPQERAALQRYMDAGGRAMFYADPDHGTTLNELLEPLGVQATDSLAASDNTRFVWAFRGEGPSPYNLATMRTSSHPSVQSINRGGGRLGVYLKGAGGLTKAEKLPEGTSVAFTLRSMSGNWLDANRNGKFDAPEKRTSVEFGAAVRKSSSDKDNGHGEDLWRALVFSDADIIGDPIVLNQGNRSLVEDGIRWLAGDEDLGGTIETEKDVRIVHRREEDVVWFYGSSLILPGLVLTGGLFYTRRSRRKRGA